MSSRCWIYLRKSRAEGNDPDVLSAHRSAILRLARAHGDAPVIREEVGSGDTLTSRPVFSALLTELLALPPGAGGILYCMDIDRLTRGALSDRGQIQQALLHAGITIRTPGRDYDLARPDDDLMYEIRGLLGRQELAAYKRRAAAGRDDLTRRGIPPTGRGTYGYRWSKDEKRLLVVDEEFPIAQALFREAPELSVRRLAARYDLPIRTVARVLRNPVYCGYPARHCREQRWNGPKRARGQAPLPREQWLWPEQPGDYPAAVSRADWNQVQAALDRRIRGREKTTACDDWARDVVEFEACPGRVHLGTATLLPGMKSRLAYKIKPPDASTLYIYRETVHERAETAILRVLGTPGLLSKALALKAQVDREGRGDGATGRPGEPEWNTQSAMVVGKLRARLDDLLRREQAATDSEETASIARVRASVRKEIVSLLARQQQEAREGASIQAQERLLAALAEAEPGPEMWEQATEREKRELCGLFLERVVVRITPQPGRWLREVVRIDYRPWLLNCSG